MLHSDHDQGISKYISLNRKVDEESKRKAD